MTKEKIINIISKVERDRIEAQKIYPDIRDLKEVYAEQILIELEKEKPRRYLMVEDGSIDIDDLEEDLEGENIKIIVYRQGSEKPHFLEV